jgi:hypothetical protein
MYDLTPYDIALVSGGCCNLVNMSWRKIAGYSLGSGLLVCASSSSSYWSDDPSSHISVGLPLGLCLGGAGVAIVIGLFVYDILLWYRGISLSTSLV